MMELRVVERGFAWQLGRMEITVTKPIEEFIERQLAKGYSDANEVARQAFLRWMEDEEFDGNPPRLDEKLTEARQGPFRPFDPQRYDALATPSHEAAR
jgi:Arc/MetJ-type ribon-helix-helix transcriptional regulator